MFTGDRVGEGPAGRQDRSGTILMDFFGLFYTTPLCEHQKRFNHSCSKKMGILCSQNLHMFYEASCYCTNIVTCAK